MKCLHPVDRYCEIISLEILLVSHLKIKGIIDAGFAQVLAGSDTLQSNPLGLRFSRHSYSFSENKRHFCIILCRVLLSSVLTVSGDIQPLDIKMANEKGCDAVFSSSR